jgi:pimeloyl-ACP methyl ester carboxylesterase
LALTAFVPGTPSATSLQLTVTADANGRAEAFYTPPDYFLRPSQQKQDFDRVERQVALTVYQNNVGTAIVDIALRRPPVFLVHGLLGSISVWDDFHPLVPVGVDAEYFKSRPGWAEKFGGRGRFDLFNVGSKHPTERLTEEVKALRRHIALSLLWYLPGYAIGKIDLVAHSMGGMMSRKMTGEDAQIRDAVRKLIIINSPLRGTPLADKIIETRDLLTNALSATPSDPWSWFNTPPPEVRDNFCYNAFQIIGNVPGFNLFNGAIEDLQTALVDKNNQPTEVQKLIDYGNQVPTHHIVTETTGVDLSYHKETRLLWWSLGLFCNWTPETNTVNTTQLLKFGPEAAKTIVQFIASRGSGGSSITLGFLEGAKTAAGGLAIDLNPPTPIFKAPDAPNDRLVPVSSQLEGLSLMDPSVTHVFGDTDHQDIKSTNVPVDKCVDIDPTSGVKHFHTPTQVPDLDGDGQPDAVCHVIELLELDPTKPQFKQP